MYHLPFFSMILPLVFIAVIVLVFLKIVDYLKLKATLSGDGTESSTSLEEIKGHLDEIERRLTDVQDVMLALNEKFDRWEMEQAKI
jgi:hypothetical protein